MILESAAQWAFAIDGDEYEFVAAGGWIVGAPKAIASQRMFEASGVLAMWGFFKPLGGATARITLGVEVEHADRETQQARHLDVGESGLPIGAAGVLQLSFEDGSRWVFGPAVCAGVTPGLPFYGRATTWEQWTFVADPRPTFTEAD
ncbi:hypothetical protein HNR46_001579 [Haloferula luteola]|uniref:Uncharacterized protein n=1 Tax=Haloferula luteola TaxID=595692 RepID=A0A840V1R5_9BACT|nr:hypothetical protein [Haloferula luteola]MBB5351343.1 hypothetical protein [Haloferula luteola]